MDSYHEIAPAQLDAGRRLARLYDAHADDIRRWVPRIVGSAVDAEDVVHEVFIVVQRRLDEFRGDAKVTTWLYRITTFVALRQLRQLRGASANLADHLVDELPSPEPSPCEQLEQKQAAAVVHAALAGLDGKHRDVLVLFELDGRNGEEIADLTATRLPTVWVRLHRGRARFRKRWQELQSTAQATEDQRH